MIACKLEEIKAPTVADFVYISADSYSREEIIDMELSVCSLLKFRLAQTTPYHFVDELVRASCRRGYPQLRSMVYYLLELSTVPYHLMLLSPSLVTAAAVYLARATLGIRQAPAAARGCPSGIWTKSLEYYSGYSVLDLEDVVLALHTCQRGAEGSKLTNAFSKYNSDKFHHVSLKTVPLEEDLGF